MYELGIIFDFSWMRWYDRQEFIKDPELDYSQLSLLEVSMLLTCLFRSDRVNPGMIEYSLENGVISKLIDSLIQ